MASRKLGLAAREREIMRLSAEGKTYREISQWLGDEHGIKVSYQSVGKFVHARREQLAEVSKTVVREKLAPGLVADVERLNKIAVDSMKLADAAYRQAMPEDELVSLEAALAYPKLAANAIKATEAKLKAAGVDQPDDTLSSLAEAERRLVGELDRLAGRGAKDKGV